MCAVKASYHEHPDTSNIKTESLQDGGGEGQGGCGRMQQWQNDRGERAMCRGMVGCSVQKHEGLGWVQYAAVEWSRQ